MNLLIFNIGDTIREAFIGVLLTLDGIVYGLISTIYKIYIRIASARILTNEAFTVIANKMYVIIGVAVLFVLAYSIIRSIIDPDQLGKGDMSGKKIISGVITCVLGLALTPVIFNVIYQGQEIILKQNILGKIFLASDSRTTKYDDVVVNNQVVASGGEIKDDEVLYDDAGNVVAAYIWQSFFLPSDLSNATEETIKATTADYFINPSATALTTAGCAVGALVAVGGAIAGVFTFGAGTFLGLVAVTGLCGASVGMNISNAVDAALGDEITLSEAFSYAMSSGDFGIFVIFANGYIEGDIQYFWGISTLVGLFVAYAFLSFSIDMAVRAAKLAYFQVIAPVPLILQILPKFKSNFEKWVKNIISTFLEVFVRLSIVYVIVYIISHITTLVPSFTEMLKDENVGIGLAFLNRTILIVGLVIFGKQAPKMISDTFGIQTGDMKLGLGKKLAEGGAFTAVATVGAVGGSLAQNFGANFTRARQEMAKKDTYTGKFGTLTKGLARSTVSGVAGGLSAGVRTGYRGVRDFKKNPIKFRDMKNATANGVREANDKRISRENFNREHKNEEAFGGVVKGPMAGHVNNVTSSVKSFLTGGTVDTSYYDNQVAALNKFKSLKGQLEDNVKSQDITNAQNEVDRLKGQGIKDFVYTEQQRAERPDFDRRYNSDRETILHRAAGMSDADYEAAFTTKLNDLKSQYMSGTMDPTDERVYEQFTRKYGSDITAASLDKAFQRDFESRYGKLSDFVLDPTTDAYKRATENFNAQLKAATDKVKEEKTKAVQAKLVEAISMGDNDTSRALKEFMTSNQSLFRNANNTTIDGKRFEVYLEELFGSNILNGQVDMANLFNGKTYNYEIKGEHLGHETIENVQVKFDNGVPSYTLMESGGTTRDLTKEQFDSFMSEAGRKRKIDATTIVGDSYDPFKDMKTASEKAKDDIVNSRDYQDAQSRKRQQSERK